MCCRMYGRKDAWRKAGWGRDPMEAEPGGKIPIRTSKGTYLAVWGGVPKKGDSIQGHARSETLQSRWLDKKAEPGCSKWNPVDIVGVRLFAERNTVGGDRNEIVRFEMPEDAVIKGIARTVELSKGSRIIDVRVITEKSAGAVKDIHRRMPMVRSAEHKENGS